MDSSEFSGEGYYLIKWSDGGMDWTSEGPIWFETSEDLAEEMSAAEESATETHLPYAERVPSPRTKADFKAMRELLGMSQQDVADELCVALKSAQRWESPAAAYHDPPQDAWEMLDEYRALQCQVVDFAVSKVGETHKELEAEPREVVLSYWRDQDSFDAEHPGEGSYTMANANTRLIADRLESFDYAVRFVYPED